MVALSHWTMVEGRRIALAVVVLSIFSQLAVPFYPVPLTLQTVAVLGVGMLLAPGQAVLSVLSWMTLGALGLPVFAGLSFGPMVLLGPSGGYIFGFLLAAPLLSFLCRRQGPLGMVRLGAYLALTDALILFCGWLFLAFLLEDYISAFFVGVYPFLFVEAVKIAVVLGADTLWKVSQKK